MNATIRALLVALILVAPAAANAQTIKIGTLAPEGSLWHEVLVKMGQRWKTISNGSVTLRIFPGGVEGPEPTMLRKVAIGQLQAAALSSAG